MSDPKNAPSAVDRRTFLKHSAMLAATPLVLGSRPAPFGFHGGGSDTLKVGLIGCGGRGSGAATQALAADPGVVLWAMADAFKDKLDAAVTNITAEAGDRVQVPPERQFTGTDGYLKLLESGVDVVLLATPPGFRPRHLRAAVDAGKHVFCEKPMAVDGPGVRSVIESAKKAQEKKLSLVCGFCWRYSPPEKETMKRVHDGAIGALRAIYTVYNTGPVHGFKRKPQWSEAEFQLRNWYHFTYLGGDHIVEQAVHSIDKMMWAMNGETPTSCVAVGGRAAREGEERGNIFDHFGVTWEFKSGARGFHMCRQIENCSHDNTDTILGEKGSCFIHGFANRREITGPQAWKWSGDGGDMYQVEHDVLFKSIRDGSAHNDGEWMVKSTLAAIQARMAAYTGQTVTWEQALNSKEELFDGNYGAEGRPRPPVPVPGRTKFG